MEKDLIGSTLVIAGTYYLYCMENDRDYYREAIEILLQVMEKDRDKLALILTKYKAQIGNFGECNSKFRSRIGCHIKFPDYIRDEFFKIIRKYP
jgi:hypothetical protein